jgi:hypothetical protein
MAPSWFLSVSRHPLRGMPAMWPCLASRVAAATGLAWPPRSVTRLSAKPLRFAHAVGLGARADSLGLPVARRDPQPARARVAATAVKHRPDECFRMGSCISDKATPGAGVRHGSPWGLRRTSGEFLMRRPDLRPAPGGAGAVRGRLRVGWGWVTTRPAGDGHPGARFKSAVQHLGVQVDVTSPLDRAGRGSAVL